MGDGTIGSTAAELKGLAKEGAGEATEDVDLKAEGATEENQAETGRTNDPDSGSKANATDD